MEGKSFLRGLFLISAVASVVLLTLITLPTKPDLHDCTSAFCTARNRLLRHPADVPRHPLDPLTVGEINRVHNAIKGFFTGKVYGVHSLVLEEPDKEVVLRWRSGEPLPPRRASVIARAAARNYIMTVDVASGEITS